MVERRSLLLRSCILLLSALAIGCHSKGLPEGFDLKDTILFTAYQRHTGWTTSKDYKEIFLITSSGDTPPILITDNRHEEVAPIWLSDGENIVFLRHRGRIEEPEKDIYLKNLATGSERRVIRADLERKDIGFWKINFFESISSGPNKTLFFQRGGSLYQASQTGQTIEKLFDLRDLGLTYKCGGFIQPISDPSASADGLAVVFISQNGKRIDSVISSAIPQHLPPVVRRAKANDMARKMKEVSLANTDGSDFKVLTDDFFPDYEPVLSPDGRYICYVSERTPYAATQNTVPTPEHFDGAGQVVTRETGNFDIYVMDISGDNVRRLTTERSKDVQPSWSPDGTQIAFVSDRSGIAQIWVMNADGTDQHPLTRGDRVCSSPCWSPR
ncbi:hypothetical protein E3J62_01635 [candidate division TA06 bacterium]|uniref:Dipeptidylpeptidase IV N-terminal domain-containing protein n=1 Tax=candidate division TA06 bacterium TaxID=2250710 RepID=A0A523UY30_UNCT6|nr:MAG: hypothetical protein E3J62_01635 [candidate division TA06 bacterium]